MKRDFWTNFFKKKTTIFSKCFIKLLLLLCLFSLKIAENKIKSLGSRAVSRYSLMQLLRRCINLILWLYYDQYCSHYVEGNRGLSSVFTGFLKTKIQANVIFHRKVFTYNFNFNILQLYFIQVQLYNWTQNLIKNYVKITKEFYS